MAGMVGDFFALQARVQALEERLAGGLLGPGGVAADERVAALETELAQLRRPWNRAMNFHEEHRQDVIGDCRTALATTGRRHRSARMLASTARAGERAIAERLQEPGGLQYTERILMDKGYLAKTERGRILIQAGTQRALEAAAA